MCYERAEGRTSEWWAGGADERGFSEGQEREFPEGGEPEGQEREFPEGGEPEGQEGEFPEWGGRKRW